MCTNLTQKFQFMKVLHVIWVHFSRVCWVSWFETIKGDRIKYVVSFLDEKITVLYIRITSNLLFFLQFVFKFWKFLWLGKFKTLENETASYVVCYFEESCSILLQKYLKWPWWVGNKNSNFNVSHAKFWIFWEVSIVGRKKTTANKCVFQ